MYGKDDTGHRGLSDQDIANERKALADVDKAFSDLMGALHAARRLTSIHCEAIDEMIGSIDDIRPDPEAWEEAIQHAANAD